MKKFTKLLSAMLAVMMIVSSIGMIAFAENADVTITFANAALENASAEGSMAITNIVNTASGREVVEGWNIGNKIVFNFGTAMKPETLNPTNIKIYLGSAYGVTGDRLNKETMEWTYTKYEATETTYTIYISDMCEGHQVHSVTFTSGVQTADEVPINEVTKKFKTGRVAKDIEPADGKVLKDVAHGKDFINESTGAAVTVWTAYQADYSTDNNTRAFMSNGKSYKIDLGNYYDIEDVVFYSFRNMSWAWNQTVKAAYSNDPNATYETATPFGTFAKSQYMNSTDAGAYNDGANKGGRGIARWLRPADSVRARYIFLKCESGDYGEPVMEVRVIANVDTDYGQMTATKDGAAATTCTGAGEYTFTVPATQHVADTAGGYMIVAGYDINGVITAIKCNPAEYADSALTMTATMPANTVSIKASLIKDFTSPYLVTDALELPAAQ